MMACRKHDFIERKTFTTMKANKAMKFYELILGTWRFESKASAISSIYVH